jgi:hypothetical protein
MLRLTGNKFAGNNSAMEHTVPGLISHSGKSGIQITNQRGQCLAAILMAVVFMMSNAVAQNPFAAATSTNNALPDRLSLFEPLEDTDAGSSSGTSTPTASTVGFSGPRFTLVGVSQFGSRRQARLRDQSGEELAVELADQAVGIPGYPGFRLESDESRSLLLHLPSSENCIASEDRGVDCVAAQLARLELTTLAPLAPAPVPASDEENADNDGEGDDEGRRRRDNPFAAALRAARERGENVDPAVMRAEAQRFQPRRINPEDVPEGARLIRTPFGDRIVREEP